jgi:hypothetical protein
VTAPCYDAATVGLAYSQDPDGTTAYSIALADDATTFLGHADSFLDTADIASDSNDVSERSKPFLLVGSSLTAIFVAGVMATSSRPWIKARARSRCLRALPLRLRGCRVRRPPRRSRCPRRSLPPLRRRHLGRRHGTAEGCARPRRREWWCAPLRPPRRRCHPHPPLRRPLWFRRGPPPLTVACGSGASGISETGSRCSDPIARRQLDPDRRNHTPKRWPTRHATPTKALPRNRIHRASAAPDRNRWKPGRISAISPHHASGLD